eukprot:2030777-Rhodomonas_salina.1
MAAHLRATAAAHLPFAATLRSFTAIYHDSAAIYGSEAFMAARLTCECHVGSPPRAARRDEQPRPGPAPLRPVPR